MTLERNFSVISDAAGFALMKWARLIDAAYEQSPLAKSLRAGLQRLRAALPKVNPVNYRGIERCPLSEDARPPIGWAGAVEDVNLLEEQNKNARDRFRAFLGPNHTCAYSPCCLVPTLEQAVELLSLVDSPSDYEIVRLSKALPESLTASSRFLGLDVGYWGGGNFSILCDTAIWPVWHGPDEESLADLPAVLANLNQHMLFPNYQSADRFRMYYRAQPWAEIEDEPGEFCIIGVERVED